MSQGSTEPVLTQRRDEGGRVPVTVRHPRPAALSKAGPAVEACHLGVQARFIEEDESLSFPAFLRSAPPSTSHSQIGPVLFGGAQRFFYSSSPGAPVGATRRLFPAGCRGRGRCAPEAEPKSDPLFV